MFVACRAAQDGAGYGVQFRCPALLYVLLHGAAHVIGRRVDEFAHRCWVGGGSVEGGEVEYLVLAAEESRVIAYRAQRCV